MSFWARCIGLTALLVDLFLPAGAGAVEKYVCVWRNPERTMRRLFPEARDYRTVTRDITPEKLARIEARTGSPLLPGQRETFQYYEMLDGKGETIGVVIAASQKGKYGAIEFVMGLDLTRSVNGIYVQRARERDREFKKPEFLAAVVGHGVGDIAALDSLLEGRRTVGTEAVVAGLKKELAGYDELAGEEPRKKDPAGP